MTFSNIRNLTGDPAPRPAPGGDAVCEVQIAGAAGWACTCGARSHQRIVTLGTTTADILYGAYLHLTELIENGESRYLDDDVVLRLAPSEGP